jgi:Fur family transcriptional regulator, zinc uptake regulator
MRSGCVCCWHGAKRPQHETLCAAAQYQKRKTAARFGRAGATRYNDAARSGLGKRGERVAMTAVPQVIFPAPGHDHGRCASTAIARAEELCAARAQRLTPMRRNVLEALLASHKPLGAYEIIEQLAEANRPAPITVYRALEFLRDNGLVHRIESRNAFVACVHRHAEGDPVVFLICERCGAVGEAPGGAVAETLKASCRVAGFSPKSPVIEIAGVCSHCRER